MIYDRRASEEWVEQVLGATDFKIWMNREAVALQGTCHRCGHQIDDFIPLDIEYAKRFAWGEAEIAEGPIDPKRAVPTVFACNCAAAHEGRPEGGLGCGAYGGLIVGLEQREDRESESTSPTSERPRVRLRSDVARTAELAWDQVASKIEHNRLSDAQTTAGKWSATVAAVLGAFGVATLVEGAESIRELEVWWAIGVGLLAALAAVSALYAIGLTALAAQGMPRVVDYVTGASLRSTTHKAARDAARRTRRGVRATFVSAGLIVLALVVLVAGPRKPPEAGLLRVETRTGKVYCETQISTPPGLVAVKAPAGLPSDLIPLSEVRALKSVGKC